MGSYQSIRVFKHIGMKTNTDKLRIRHFWSIIRVMVWKTQNQFQTRFQSELNIKLLNHAAIIQGLKITRKSDLEFLRQQWAVDKDLATSLPLWAPRVSSRAAKRDNGYSKIALKKAKAADS